MESGSKMFHNVKFEKEKTIAGFNHLRRLIRLLQLIEVATVFAAISWCSSRAPDIVKSTDFSLLEFSTCLSNRHVVFLIGNAIIMLLFILFRQSDAATSIGSREIYDDCVKCSETARAMPPPLQQVKKVTLVTELGDCDKHIVAVCGEETTAIAAIPQ